MNLEIGDANTNKDSETRDSDVAVIKSIVGYSSTLKNRCVAYMDSPESDFSYEQLAELVKAYRVYSRSCGDIVRLIYEFYDYDEVEACEKTVDITKDNFSEHISAAKNAVDERLVECRKKYNETFYTEDEEECAKILREVRAERRSLEELMRLFESLNNSFETYFGKLDSEYMNVPAADEAETENTDKSEAYENTFNVSDYLVNDDEIPAAENDTYEESYTEEEAAEESEDTENNESEEETAAIEEKTSTLEDILAEFAEDEDYAEIRESRDGDEYDYNEAYRLYTEGEAEENYSEEYTAESEADEADNAVNVANTEEETENIAETENEDAETEDTNAFEDEAEKSEEEYEDSEQIEFELPELPSEDDISDEAEVPAEKTDEEKFIDFIDNSSFETYKAVFEPGGDIKREINITTIAESGFTKLHGKDKWSENCYINDVFGIYRQYTSISADDSEIRRGIIRAGAVKRISDFLTSVGIEASAENIMQIDRLCPIEFSAPDAAVIETDSTYILSVFKAVYDYLHSDKTAPIAINVHAKKKDAEPYAEAEEVFFEKPSEKFFEFSSDEDYDDYETSKYVAADYEAAAREAEDAEENSLSENTAEKPEYSFDEKYQTDTQENTFESSVSEPSAYEEYVKEPEPIEETSAPVTPITIILNGKEEVYPSWAEAERAFCEYAIKAKPFAMALINRRNDNINGQKIFNRATYETPNTINLSNGLQAYAAGNREDFQEICGRVMNICSIEKDVLKIIESGAFGE